jgi:hypothetical protein
VSQQNFRNRRNRRSTLCSRSERLHGCVHRGNPGGLCSERDCRSRRHSSSWEYRAPHFSRFGLRPCGAEPTLFKCNQLATPLRLSAANCPCANRARSVANSWCVIPNEVRNPYLTTMTHPARCHPERSEGSMQSAKATRAPVWGGHSCPPPLLLMLPCRPPHTTQPRGAPSLRVLCVQSHDMLYSLSRDILYSS